MSNDDDVLRDDSRRAAAFMLAYIDGDKEGMAYHMNNASGRETALILALLALIREVAPAVFADASRPFYERWVDAAADE